MPPPGQARSPPFARTDTPPRSGSAPIRLLRICLDERVLGGVEVNESSTLADVRITIQEDEIEGVPENYQFLFGGAPVSRRQEGRRRAVDCFPFVSIIQADVRVVQATGGAGGAEGGDTPSAGVGGDGGAFEPAVSHAPTVPTQGGLGTSQQGVRPTHAAGAVISAEAGDAVGAAGGLGTGISLELQITDGPLEGTTMTVGAEGARMGRHTSNTIVIPEAGISRYHAEICYLDGEFCVRDLGSTTGTYFYLRPHGHFQMFTGLMVKLGETELQVLAQTLPSSENPEQVVLFYEGPLAGHKVHLPARGITIGRRHNNDLVLVQDGTISAHHAMIFFMDGDFFLQDLGSCNGTCVRLSSESTDSDWHPILDGDILGAGCTKIRCRLHRT